MKKKAPAREKTRVSEPEMIFTEGGIGLLDRIAPLWQKLTLDHADFSPFFAEEFRNRAFSDRKKELLIKASKKKMRVILARSAKNRTLIGYTVGTINAENIAEIDSLFVDKPFRRSGAGSRLVSMILQWFALHRPDAITVNVAVGNETTLAFYRRFGFFPRVITLVKKH
ncbi:MAG: GNAT family N-acetyltransferase [Chitinispirillaceae bacterium]|nr:GNAT family N-acetyltransferase [Chitinispirillaceae bacterium]